MNRTYRIVAQKYAQAFLDCYDDQLDMAAVTRCRDLSLYLNSQRQISFFLHITTLDDQVKQDGIWSLCQEFKLPACIQAGLTLLNSGKRVYLFQDFLHMVYLLYLERHGYTEFEFVTAHPLSESDARVMQQFLAHKTGRTIIYTCRVDQSLIAGVRLISQTMQWHYSIAERVHRLISVVSK